MGDYEPLSLDLHGASAQIVCGDAFRKLRLIDDGSVNLVISSPPYNIGKEYEKFERRNLNEYKRWMRPIAKRLVEKLSVGGSLCWQSGAHVQDGIVTPLDYIFYDMFTRLGLTLRNRIIWHFNFGHNASTRFSGRHETLLWFTKTDNYTFNLDPVRVRQLYPGKRHSSTKGSRAGQLSGNPSGKNPGDVWAFDPVEAFHSNELWRFPNVKANHPEKTPHPCQFPIELVERCVLALTNPGDMVLDPFVGTGTSVLAACLHDRRAIGIDKFSRYVDIANERLADLRAGTLRRRTLGKSVLRPNTQEKVAAMPAEWLGRLGALDERKTEQV